MNLSIMILFLLIVFFRRIVLMQSFILLLVHALWPNDILEHSHTDTVAPCEITAIINRQRDSSLITHSHKRHGVTKHKTARVSRAHL